MKTQDRNRPKSHPVRLEVIPIELKKLPRWVCWRYHFARRKGKWEKRPVNCRSGRQIDITHIQEMSDFEQALARYQNPKRKVDGIGFTLFGHDPFSGIDLDKCRDSETGELQPWANEIIRQMDTYTEVSPSGRGIRLFVRGKVLPGSKSRKGNIEVYSFGRYLTVTGIHLSGAPTTIKDGQDNLAWLQSEYLADIAEDVSPSTVAWAEEPTDDEVIVRAKRARNGGKFIRLFEQADHSAFRSPSEADLALCGMLTYWLGPYATADRVERLFGQSGLGKSDKWLGREDYRRRTIEQALRGSRECQPRGKMLIRTRQTTQDYSGDINTVSGSENRLSCEVEELAVRAAVDLAGDEYSRHDWEVMFVLARRLRRISGGVFSVPSFRRAVDAFCEHAHLPAEEYWITFMSCWKKSLLAEGEHPLEWAFKMAEKYPVPSSSFMSKYYDLLASIAWHLSRLNGSRPFYLPVQQLASLLDVSAMTVSRTIDLLEGNHVVKCTNNEWSYKEHKAKEYIYIGSSADEVAEVKPPRLYASA